MPARCLLAVLLAAAPAAPAADFAGLGLPADLSKPRLRELLQRFVDEGQGRRFERLGDESDFDHGHILLDSRTGRPVAILYHTRELAWQEPAPPSSDQPRNWIQWLDDRGIEDARRYERDSYPSSGAWDWFVARDLPRYQRRGTLVDRMLDPHRLGVEIASGPQWTFTRAACGAQATDARSAFLDVRLPAGPTVCLALGAS